VLAEPGYADAARRIAVAIRELPSTNEAVAVLTGLAG
jgi:hypothetical protein